MTPSTRAQAALPLWRQARLGYQLRSHQVELRQAWRASHERSRRFVVCCARRFGKSRWLCVEAVQFALRKPGAQIRYAAPTAKMVRNIIVPHLKAITAEAPEDLRGRYNAQAGVWSWPNGSELHIAGCDKGNAESLRGTDTDLGIVDEGGFIDELGYVVRSVLMPQTLTVNGRIIIASTPSKTPAHEFTGFCSEAKANRAYIHRTIYDNPFVTPALLEEYIRESGGEDSSDWKREYLAKFVVDQDLAVVPEFPPAEDEIVMEWERPTHFHTYVAIDLGYSDLTVGLLAYYDFENGLLIIEDEVVTKHSTSDVIDKMLREKEKELWCGRALPFDHPRNQDEWEPVKRVVDAPLITMQDLRRQTGRVYKMAKKDDAEAALNRLRLWVQRRRIRINPRCVHLISHLSFAIWNKSRTKMERSGDHGHFDAVDAAKYLVRSIEVNRNPFPPSWHGGNRETQMVRAPKPGTGGWAKLGKKRAH